MNKRKALIRILTDVLNGTISIESMSYQIEPLLKEGLDDCLSKQESRIFYNFIAWYSDQYDRKKQPRPGFLGRAKDLWAQTFRGEYRVSDEMVKAQAKKIVDLMTQQ